MATIVRIPISNVYMDGDYTGSILVGPDQKPMNVILDTGSSALALDGTKYAPTFTGGESSTKLAQTDAYGDGSTWTGAVIQTPVAAGAAAAQAVLPNANVAVAYDCSASMFRGADGILGLAYAPLDDAFAMAGDTWANKYPEAQVRQGQAQDIQPYLTQLSGAGVVADKIAFLTRRSFVHEGAGGADDPLNQGWMILGGGEEQTDLYSGTFQTVSVLSDAWYCTNLKSITVGTSAPITARVAGPKGMPSNSIVDSGTNSLNLGSQLLTAVLAKFTPAQRALLETSIRKGQPVPNSELDLTTWPTISFVLQGDTGDVALDVLPGDYWQLDTGAVGQAMAAITLGQPGLAILGLPLMNGYYTIFDGEADNGRGVIKFATAVR
jgi:hypothetical protein